MRELDAFNLVVETSWLQLFSERAEKVNFEVTDANRANHDPILTGDWLDKRHFWQIVCHYPIQENCLTV